MVCDVWAELPVRSGVAAAVLNVFAPRNPSEMRRVLHDRGVLVVVHPTARHLQEIVETLGLLTVDAAKEQRLAYKLGPAFELTTTSECEYEMSLTPAALSALVAMGPSARHTGVHADLPATEVTASVTVSTYAPRA